MSRNKTYCHAESKEYGIQEIFPVIKPDRFMEEISEQDIRLIPEICTQLGNRRCKEDTADSHDLSEEDGQNQVEYRCCKYTLGDLLVHSGALAESRYRLHKCRKY